MQTEVETINPTRVRLLVEVPYEELRPALDSAYKRIAAQVNIPGFRKGKVPAKLIDQRFGPGVVLEEAVNDALPKFYGKAVEDNAVSVVGQPEVEVTEVPDPQARDGQLKFAAEVDVRPVFELPDFSALEVTVDSVEVSDADVDEQLTALRERFGSLRPVERAAQEGDFLTIDLVGTVDGEAVEGLSSRGLSYQVGTQALLPGLDEAVQGLSAGESATFPTSLVGGEHAGKEADVEVTVKAVRERDLPELDDTFAQTASEFDTVQELREQVRVQLERRSRSEQVRQARDRVLEAALAQVDIPLPESVVQAEIAGRQQSLASQLETVGWSKEQYLEREGQTEEQFDTEVTTGARDAVKAQLLLDEVANKEQFGVSEEELTDHLLRRAADMNVSPDELIQRVMRANQVAVLMSEIVRGKALAQIVETATVRDTAGNSVDVSAIAADEPAYEYDGEDEEP